MPLRNADMELVKPSQQPSHLHCVTSSKVTMQVYPDQRHGNVGREDLRHDAGELAYNAGFLADQIADCLAQAQQTLTQHHTDTHPLKEQLSELTVQLDSLSRMGRQLSALCERNSALTEA